MSQDQDHGLLATLKPRRLIRGEITYSHAEKQDANILHELGYRDQKIQFFTHLYRNRTLIKKIIAHHLGLAEESCHVTDVEDWIDGSFNVCIRVDVGNRDQVGNQPPAKQVMIRFPLPYKIGENSYPGNGMRKFAVKPGHTCGSKRIVQTSRFRDCMDMASLTVKVYSLTSQSCNLGHSQLFMVIPYSHSSRFLTISLFQLALFSIFAVKS